MTTARPDATLVETNARLVKRCANQRRELRRLNAKLMEKRGGYLTVSGLRFALDDTKADMRRQARELQYEKERISTIARLITEWRAAPMGADGDAIIESIADLLE